MRTRVLTATVAAAAILVTADADAQDGASPSTGPVIADYGAVYPLPDADLPTPIDHVYRVVFDVALSPENPGEINRRIVTLARFLNMHAQAGVPAENMELALVVHGAAGKDLLQDDAYHRRHGVANPNRPVLEALAAAGVQIVLCGQTAAFRDLPATELIPEAQMALSAMTALALLQDRGYALIAF
jgi:intracellular sulfur oxidation DsrE/DsrF family protein